MSCNCGNSRCCVCEKGERGLRGVDGIPGADSNVAGPTGPQGGTGPQGSIGLQGPVGADSVVAGPQGIGGPQGIPGFTGDTGPQGPQGNDGTLVPPGMMQVTGGVEVNELQAYDYNAFGNASEVITLAVNSLQTVYASVIYDTFPVAGSFNLATGVWTCPTDGFYDFSFYYNFSENGNIDGGGSSQTLDRGWYAGEFAAGLFIKGPNDIGGPVKPITYTTYENVGRKVVIMITGARIGYRVFAGEQVVLRAYQISNTDWTGTGLSGKTLEIRLVETF